MAEIHLAAANGLFKQTEPALGDGGKVDRKDGLVRIPDGAVVSGLHRRDAWRQSKWEPVSLPVLGGLGTLGASPFKNEISLDAATLPPSSFSARVWTIARMRALRIDEYYRRDGHRAQRFWHLLPLMLGEEKEMLG